MDMFGGVRVLGNPEDAPCEEELARDRAERRRNRIVLGVVGSLMVLAGGAAMALSVILWFARFG